MTRTLPLWVLFGLVLAAGTLLARARRVSAGRAAVAWVLSSVLLWACAGLFGYLGGRLTYGPAAASSVNLSGMRGLMIGAPLGALVGAPLGIALSEKAMQRSWPRRRSLFLAALALAACIAIVLFLLVQLEEQSQQAGKSVLVVFPLLGASAVLGWLAGEQK